MALPVLGLSHCTGSLAGVSCISFVFAVGWLALRVTAHFKIKLISTTLKNLSCERASALRPFFSPRVNKVPTYQKDP